MTFVSAEDDEIGVLRETSDSPPAHYLFKIESLSLFSENGVDQIKSKPFKAGEHQWQILLFPEGNDGGKGDHVSIYLMLESTSTTCANKYVNASFKFFLFDQIRGKYLTVEGRARRFDGVKYKWGFAKFISLKALKEPTNGFLVNDTCFLGVEVFVSKGSRLGECLSISEIADISGKYKWEINFSQMEAECYSDEFVVGGYKWKLLLYPEGTWKCEGSSLSLFLLSVDSESCSSEHEVKAEFSLTLKDQITKNHIKKKSTFWFGASTPTWGWHSFIKLKDFKDRKKELVAQGRCIFKAEVAVLCETSQTTLDC